MKRTGGGGSTAKHSGTSKHAAKSKTKHRNPPAKSKTHGTGHGKTTTVAKHPTHAKARTLALGGVGCCPAEAVAAAARLAGWGVTGRDVLDLYARCADGPLSGFTIAAALTAGLRLADVSATWEPVADLEELAHEPGGFGVAAALGVGSVEVSPCTEVGAWAAGAAFVAAEQPPAVPTRFPAGVAAPVDIAQRPAHALILGVELPGPHAVTVAPDGCWITWGEHHDPAEWPDAVVEEAWAVSFR